MSSKSSVQRLASLLVLAGVAGCAHPPRASSAATEPSARQPAAPAEVSAAAPSAPRASAPLEETAAGRQLVAWLAAFNSADRQALLAYHELHFPYEVASRDVKDIDREHALSLGTGGFEVRRVELSDGHRLVALLRERKSAQHARVELEVSPAPPHAVARFRIRPIPTPLELLSAAERQARAVDAETRRDVIESIGQQLAAHYVFPESAVTVLEGLRKKQARGDYDALSDAVELAGVLSRDLVRLARDKHLGLHFGPLPAPPNLEGSAPPWIAQSGYGFGRSERLSGNVAYLVIRGFPPPFESQRQAIAERLTAIADADAAILDLRDNGGGFPQTVMRVASYFFDDQPVHLNSIYRRDADQTVEHWSERELPGQRFGSRKPVYVLTGPGTFSGGEGFAYALQAQGRALVVGEGTAGGAHPTQPYPVAGGFVLRVPWGRSINPVTGTNWQGVGVVPDVFAPAEEALEIAHELALEKLGARKAAE